MAHWELYPSLIIVVLVLILLRVHTVTKNQVLIHDKLEEMQEALQEIVSQGSSADSQREAIFQTVMDLQPVKDLDDDISPYK